MVSWSERMISHTGTDTRSRLLREAAVRNFAQWGETLTQQRRVSDEGFRVVKLCQVGRNHEVIISLCADGTTEGSTG